MARPSLLVSVLVPWVLACVVVAVAVVYALLAWAAFMCVTCVPMCGCVRRGCSCYLLVRGGGCCLVVHLLARTPPCH